MFSGAGTKNVPLFQFVNCTDKLPFGKEYSTVILEYNFSVSLASFISAKGIAGKLRDTAVYFVNTLIRMLILAWKKCFRINAIVRQRNS